MPGMTYPEAMAIRMRQLQRQPVDADDAAEALRVIQASRGQVHAPASQRVWPAQVAHASPDACECGGRLGQHRFGDEACPNPKWRCGNGQPQWLQRFYVRMQRAAAAPSAAQP